MNDLFQAARTAADDGPTARARTALTAQFVVGDVPSVSRIKN